MKYKEQATKMAVETDVLDYDQCWKVIAVLYLSGNSICVSSGSPLAECISECQLNEYLPDYFSILQSLGNAKTVSISKNNFVDDLSQLIQYTHVWFPNTNQLKYYA